VECNGNSTGCRNAAAAESRVVALHNSKCDCMLQDTDKTDCVVNCRGKVTDLVVKKTTDVRWPKCDADNANTDVCRSSKDAEDSRGEKECETTNCQADVDIVERLDQDDDDDVAPDKKMMDEQVAGDVRKSVSSDADDAQRNVTCRSSESDVMKTSVEVESSADESIAKNSTDDDGIKCNLQDRRRILESTETYASIIGREIAASFNLTVDLSQSPSFDGCSEREDCDDETPVTKLANGLSHNGMQVLQPRNGLKVEPDVMDLSSTLDTVEVAQRVRDVLTANNVGQRQFARHVLGLSQGTVSELLAKPKPWDRLTEKGRESYRRMHEWAGDQLGVLALKANVPRKGK
jgi:hypothetical protein